MVSLPDVPELITTDRLELRAPDLAHVKPLTAAVRASLPELKAWMPWATDGYDEAGCEASMRQAIASFALKRDLRYHIVERGTGELIGSSGLHHMKWEVPRFEIGYWLMTSRTGRGYMAEAVRALTKMAFEQLGAKRMEIRCDDRNEASAAVAERCGYGLEAVLRNYTIGTDGSLRHERVYSLLDVADLR